MFTMNISHEYLLKSRQLTWENAEVIDNLFGPVALEEKNENWREAYWHKSTDGSISNSLPSQRVCQRGYKKTKKKMYVHLDYNKVISVSVVLSPVDLDLNTKPPSQTESISSSKGDPPVVANPKERSQEDDEKECAICHKKFTNKGDLTRHLRTHTGEKPFSCPQCEKSFARKSNLNRHFITHSGFKEFSCKICHKEFTRKSDLTLHGRIHTGAKPFKCDECNAMFSRKDVLDQHLRTHTGEIPYQCEICEKEFTQMGSLKRHLLIHSGEKPFGCTYANCAKKFRRKDDLQTHVRVHTKDKPYTCRKCAKTFSRSSNCKTHAKQCCVRKSISTGDSLIET